MILVSYQHIVPRLSCKHEPGIGVLFLGMVSLVENQQIHLRNAYEAMHETLIQDFGRAHNDHMLLEMFFPDLPVPEIRSHCSAEATDAEVSIVVKNRCLLKDQCHGIHLSQRISQDTVKFSS